jgi:hypothetical protein
MKRTMSRVMLATAIALSACAGAVEWPKEEYVQINDVPDSELCRETSRAAAELRTEIGWPMTKLYGHGAAQPDRSVGKLTFPGLRVQSIEFVNGAGNKRTLSMTFYRVDIDNTPPLEMIDFVTGGHLATGGGTTLTVRRNDLSLAPQPIPDRELRDEGLLFGPLEVSFTGKDFDAGYYSYPFAFAGKNYLFIEGNGEAYQTTQDEDELYDLKAARNAAKDAVVELVPGTGLVARCYFDKKPN